MKRVALLLLPLAAACATLKGGAGAGAGADSPTAAVQLFLDAAKDRNLNAMERVWGTDQGVASKSMSRKELERRELIMMQCLHHEKANFGAAGPSEGGRLRIPVQVMMGERSASPMFTVVRSAGNRWFVENFEIEQLRDKGFCSLPPTQQKP